MIVYKATNIITKEVYIGKTIKSLSKRKSDHKYEAFIRKRHSKFYNALREYEWEVFNWEIVGSSNTHKNLALLERKLIILYNSIEQGYNTQIR